jgi:hypothetical protein
MATANKTITIGEKTFTVGQTAVFCVDYVPASWPFEPLYVKSEAEIVGIGAKRVIVGCRSLTHEDFKRLNA